MGNGPPACPQPTERRLERGTAGGRHRKRLCNIGVRDIQSFCHLELRRQECRLGRHVGAGRRDKAAPETALPSAEEQERRIARICRHAAHATDERGDGPGRARCHGNHVLRRLVFVLQPLVYPVLTGLVGKLEPLPCGRVGFRLFPDKVQEGAAVIAKRQRLGIAATDPAISPLAGCICRQFVVREERQRLFHKRGSLLGKLAVNPEVGVGLKL